MKRLNSASQWNPSESKTINQRSRQGWCSVMSLLAMSACTFEGAREEGTREAEDDLDTSVVAPGALSPNPCTAVMLVAPTQNFSARTGKRLLVATTAICPPGQSPEFQYWQRRPVDPHWTTLGPHATGPFEWIPPSPDNWCITAVVRAIGATEPYQARARPKCGIVAPHNSPVANDDVFTMAMNTYTALNVLRNDGDADGDSIFVAAVTRAAHGLAIISVLGGVGYTPDTGFVGDDSFTYAVSDGLLSDIATVRIKVLP